MISRLLIANRGEIACRIIQTCSKLGIVSIAVYSDADRNAKHVALANEAIFIGASPPTESYLNIEAVIRAAQQSRADAIHPGYGFLAENAIFAKAVADAGLTFIGPDAKAIEAMGDKRRAKLLLKDIPLVPGYNGDDQSDEALAHAAKEIGYPVMVKAAAGGGGKGMRQVNDASALASAITSAKREAQQAFGDETLILEKVIQNPRHIEIQIFGDKQGNVIAMGERECTIQRRHQKIIEETPSTALTPQLRSAMEAAAVSVGKQLNYTNAGTVEFLVDDAGNFYFMEMNTRLQVEHPVTEAVFGVDLVEWQIHVAEGKMLPELELTPSGHAIEARVYAEDPANNFLPATGKIILWDTPQTVRIDSGVRTGDEITIYYDPMIAKVIAYAPTRAAAIRLLDYNLSKLKLLGLRHNIDFLREVITHEAHISGNITTQFIEQHGTQLQLDAFPSLHERIAATISRQSESTYWRNTPSAPTRHSFTSGENQYELFVIPVQNNSYYRITLDGSTFDVELISHAGSEVVVSIDGHQQKFSVTCTKDNQYWVHGSSGTKHFRWISPLPESSEKSAKSGSLRSPMPGKIIQVLVDVGQTVNKGDVLLIVEAMKMEHRVEAPHDGTVETLYYKPGETVPGDAVLLELSINSS